MNFDTMDGESEEDWFIIKKIMLMSVLLFQLMLIGCDEKSSGSHSESFPSEQQAVQYLLDEYNQRSDVERMVTTDEEVLFVVRSGNDQYRIYGMHDESGSYSVEKLTATFSLHHSIAGGSEFTTLNGNNYTMFIVKNNKVEHLNYEVQTKYQFSPILLDSAHIALKKGHHLNRVDSDVPNNAIQQTETIFVRDYSAAK